MAVFVLVHGSFHGPWCWARLRPLLEAAGHRVITPALPQLRPGAPSGEEPGLEAYAAAIAGVIEAEDEPVVLVGHSMGGIVASAVAERMPDRLAAVVYVCGLMLENGSSLASFLDRNAHLGVEDLVLTHMRVSDDRRVATFPEDKAAEVFYGTCTAADAAWAAGQLRPQPTRVYGEALALTPSRYGRVRRFYVETLQDSAVSPVYQRAMIAGSPCERVASLDTDHSPFLSAPAALAAILEDVAGTCVMLKSRPAIAQTAGAART